MADNEIYDLQGHKYSGDLKVTLKPGFGVLVDGKHYEGGPHVLPLAVANDLLHSGKAILHNKPDVKAEEAERKALAGTQPVVQREPEVTHREPAVARSRGKKGKK